MFVKVYPYVKLVRLILLITSFLSILLGIVVLYGWATQNFTLIQVSENYTPLQPNTARLFILSGISLAFSTFSFRKLAFLFGFLVLFFSSLIMSQYLFNINLGVDQWLITINQPTITIFPGRPGPNTVFSFILIGICLLLTALPNKQIYSFFAVILSCISASIASIPLFGYIFKLYSIISWYGFTGMGIHTSVGLITLSMGIFFAHAIYLLYKGKVLYGPMIGAIFFSLYVTFFLWEGYQTEQYLGIQKLAQNNADFISHNLGANIQNVKTSLSRIASRWEILNGYDEKLWDVDVNNYKKYITSLNHINWYNKDLQLKWMTPGLYDPKTSSEEALLIEKMKEIKSAPKENEISHFYTKSSLIFLIPLFLSDNKFDGVLSAEVNLKELVESSIPESLSDCYDIELSEQKNIIYERHSGVPIPFSDKISANVNSSLTGWVVTVTPIKDPLIRSSLPKLIILAGVSSTILTTIAMYLLQKFYQAKERTLTALKEKAEDLAYRQAILDSSNSSIIATDPKGIITSFNKAAESMLLWKANEVVNKQTPEIFHDKEEIEKRIKTLSDTEREKISPESKFFSFMTSTDICAKDSEWIYVRKDGTHLPVQLSVKAVKNDSGEIIGFVGTAYDLSGIKEVELMKNQLIAITSHELRSPLGTIKGALDLANDIASEKEKNLIKIARSNCERLTRLTNDILDIEKMESGKMEYHFNDFDLEDLFKKTIEANQFYADSKNVILKKPSDIPKCIIYGDEDRILQVMTNLISNAVKHSPPNGEVSFVIEKKENSVRIGVEDHGPGIPKEFHSKVFQKFSQINQADTKKEGTGLGLSISKAIIESHGGTIGFDTSPQGSIFWFELAVQKIGDGFG